MKFVKEKDEEKQTPTVTNVTTATAGPSASSQGKVTRYFLNTKITVSMTAEKFKSCIVEMVVKNSIPLTFFSCPAFVSLNGEMAQRLGVSLTRDSIRNLVIEEAEKNKTKLKEILHGKFIYLKMDACTRHRVNYFAINVQFIDHDQKVVICTLAVKDTKAQHTSDYLQNQVMDVLKDFGITKEQILLIVTDNASNMISTIEKLNADEDERHHEEIQERTENDETDLEDDFEMVDGFVEAAAELSTIHHMRCAVHTLQLAIRDGLRQPHAANLVGRVRNIAVAARTPKLDAILKRRAGKGAILDQATRWGSTYLMIQRVLTLKPFLIDMANPDITMTDAQWQQVKELEELLRHPFIATKNLQEAELTPGSFIKEWKTLHFRLSGIGELIAEEVLKSMQRREATLMDNDILLAGIYVDPMYRVILNEDQKSKAKAALCDVAIRMKGLALQEESFDETFGDSSPARLSDDETLESKESQDEVELNFEKHLDKQEQNKRQRLDDGENKPCVVTKFKLDFSHALVEVEKINRLTKVTVKEALPQYPDIIKDAAMAVTALPPTQVSVERLFSALRIIKSDLRAAMKEDLIEAILFLRTNVYLSKV